ncbi:VWA domain-containing protein [Delftia tsuruhatensis]|uniref:vWA domain-containing protein n=1 Tax=Delftia tsuruhatensis TaxID=180282 RepID=UPI002446D1C2|nr:VWA domain-containing protein [Delftia tsuruhatensis]MDH0848331.1 VWA domain-containing protein [Delftia tsuruhatensis]
MTAGAAGAAGAADGGERTSWLGDARSGKLAGNLVGFARALRRAGVPVDGGRMALAQQALSLVGLAREDMAAALEAVFVSNAQDRAVFRELFDAYFRNPDVARQLLAQLLPQAPRPSAPRHRPRVQEALSPRQAGEGWAAVDEELKLDAAMTASERHRLRHADFNQLSASEYLLVQRLARDIALPLPRYSSRRTRTGQRGAVPDWAASLRAASHHGGEMLQLLRRERRRLPLPWLALVDVSGSMERYARLLLAFLHAATSTQRHAGLRRQVYSFGTELRDLGPAFAQADTDAMLERANAAIADFGGGTRLGSSLGELRRLHARHQVSGLVGRRTLLLIISDGLDTGDAAELDRELAWLRRHSARLLWLNPLLRFDGYAPLAQGAAVLHRHAHAMLAVHNLESLQQLAGYLARLLAAPGR